MTNVQSLGLSHFSETLNPLPLLRSGHSQTLYGFYKRRNVPLITQGSRVQIPLPDGDILDAQLLSHTEPRGVVSLFHGLGGSNQSSYMLKVGRAFYQKGWTVLLVNHRGCGKGIELPSRHPYHSGRGEDVGEVVGWSRKQFPDLFQITIGFSLGGSAVLNLVTERRGRHQPNFAIAVNAPLDVEECAFGMLKGINNIYSYSFKEDLYQTLVAKHRAGWLESVPPKAAIRNLVDVDLHYTAPASGFSTVKEFYAHCTAGRDLHRVQTPTLLFTAEDDPISKFEHYQNFKKSSSVALHAEKFGGHIGYLQGQPSDPEDSWLERALLHYGEEGLGQLS